MKHKGLTRREFVRGAALTGAGLVAAACVPVTPGVPAPAEAPTQAPAAEATAAPTATAKETINVLMVGDPWELALRTVADQFTEETDIELKMDTLGYVALMARLVNSFLTKTADADVVAVDGMWMPQYADNGWLRKLDDFIKADSDTDFSDFIPQSLYSSCTWRDSVWTLPVATYAQGIMYRTDMFEAAGLDPLPKTVAEAEAAEWTWDKYFGMLEKLNGMEMDGKEYYGTVLCGAQPVAVTHMYTQLAASYGARWFEQFPEAPWDFTPTINSPDNVAAMRDWKMLYSMAPPECINYLFFDAGTRFSQGDIGMFYWWTPYFYLVNNEGYLSGKPSPVVDKFDVGVLPTRTPGGLQINSNGGWFLGIPASSKNPEAAWQFIKWATGAKAQKAMGLANTVGNQFGDFSRYSLYKDPDLREIYPFLDTQMEGMKFGDCKVVRPPMPIYTSLEAVYGLQINQVMANAATPEKALEMTDTLFNNILTSNQMIPYEVDSFDDTLEATEALIKRLSS